MKDIYVLRIKPEFGGDLICAADDFDLASLKMADYSPETQDKMEIVNTNLHELRDIA